MSDTYCYTGTHVLRNKLGLQNQTELFQAESSYTFFRLLQLQEEPIKGSFDFDHLKAIHQYIFQDIFEWAGKPRTVNIGKNNIFCLPEYINSYAQDVFRCFASDCKSVARDQDLFAKTLAKHYGNLNALHPFREGNGRTQREFTRELCLDCGYIFDLTTTTHEEMLNASIASFNSDNTPLINIFNAALTPLSKINKSTRLQILSGDDLPNVFSADFLNQHTNLGDNLSSNEINQIIETTRIAVDTSTIDKPNDNSDDYYFD